MRRLKYSINVTLDGCIDHRAGRGDEEVHRNATALLEGCDGILLGRVTYQLMEYWRAPMQPEPPAWQQPFARAINAIKKYVVSSTLQPDWNAELIRGDLGAAVRALKQQPGKGLAVGGVTLPLALANLRLIDDFEFVLQPIVAGHGPTLLAGLRERLDLRLVDRQEFRSGAVVLRYQPAS